MADRRNRPRRPRQVTTHDVQAAVEGVILDDPDTVEFFGQRYRIGAKVGLMPLMKFAHVAGQGVGAQDLEGLAALYAVLRDCIDRTRPQKFVDGEWVDDGDSDWDRFERAAINETADGEDLFPVVQQAIEKLSARPTRRPSGSSAGPPTTSPNSKESFSSRPERPDIAALRAELVSVDTLLARSTG